MTDINYHVGKLRDDVRGLSLHINAIEKWISDLEIDKNYNISSGYIDDIKTTIILIQRCEDRDVSLKHHLATLLQYYIYEMNDEYKIFKHE